MSCFCVWTQNRITSDMECAAPVVYLLAQANLIMIRAHNKRDEEDQASPSVLVDLLRSAKSGYTDDVHATLERHIAQRRTPVRAQSGFL